MKRLKSNLLNRFLSFVKIYSESNTEAADSGVFPSTPQQWDFAKVLEQELKALGLENVQITPGCYVYGYLPATKKFEGDRPFCLLSHMDTVDEVTGKNVNPLVHENYKGTDIKLSCNVTHSTKTDSFLKEAIGETIITSDGTTLLGADDKAGVAEIISSIEYVITNKIEHHSIEVIFSPDEETGHGMDKVPLELLRSKYAYTVDGGHKCELETECFNAWKSDVIFTGKACHTGSAKNVMINANLMAAKFISMLPKNELPETTENYEGFYAVMGTESSIESAKVSLLLRDFSLEGIQNRIQTVDSIAKKVAEETGGQIKTEHTQQYLNMKTVLDKNPSVTEKLINAYKSAGIEPVFVPIRGGTDGSRLTEMGIPCPNIFTGGHNFHSRLEWASLDQMLLACKVLINLMIN